MGKPKLNQWSIEARAFQIKYTPFSHNFWALTNAHESHPADQLHGLAFDPKTKVTKAIGNSSHLLQIIHDPTILWSLQPNQPTVVCITDHEVKVKARWQAALDVIAEINGLKLPYPNLWQHFYKKNSNTIFNTLGQIMGITKPANLLPTWALGSHLIISQDIINRYRYTR